MTEVGYLTAFLAGILALLSPCGALLLPSFFAITVTSVTRFLAHAGLFYLGLATTLVPLGAGAAVLGSFLLAQRTLLIVLAGCLVIVMGLIQLLGGGFDLGRLLPRARESAADKLGTRAAGLNAYLLGLVSGVVGFCTGPILGAVLTLAAASGQPLLGGVLLALYALGMALPLFIIAAVWSRGNLSGRRWMRGRTVRIGRLTLHTTSTITGTLLIAVGVLMLVTNGFNDLPELVPTRVVNDVQVAVQGWAAEIPNAVFVIVAAVVALGVWAAAVLRGRRRGRERVQESTEA
ncbi:cytochrome c biogenesis CcdA family protein [Klugiella xanthotipulae]|uniref:Cytochrome c biogenesis protein CcdA n=1 Tax=Klugiella xanthotipulae TaxID=244735 RepID=A0A543HT81_9MICO|nr:cytochrome c biogenesis CcdA family protein [Klugiella xanthotipulae]TQM61566.1 cytochrome c biogenesis protein CcdA [Klugiella xanthotipulae]